MEVSSDVLYRGAFLHFQNLNKNPTVIQAKICVNSNKKPILELPSNPEPTVPTINKGPELFVKAISLSHSSILQIFFSFKFETILAPVG